ncbi:hypothetical protein D2V05_05310 [Flagellimonas pelagia]|uniref:Uncharacterized protein n=1 Tax=Flagellimonas pelagia TaxID=2306998 RepID=A0A3A1NM69_9FLAO|nr:hypothetical protein D2V05_05310 [Allomuricauda maritima]
MSIYIYLSSPDYLFCSRFMYLLEQPKNIFSEGLGTFYGVIFQNTFTRKVEDNSVFVKVSGMKKVI